ncbi:MAG: hypothetical protein M0D53_14740 [Flavobacterium sp. JAD_PAG50586_2]|nr:MAG: hypothetical protein M0D53_14740 [Flavobacterium sp. JAD_PAG50586_2]
MENNNNWNHRQDDDAPVDYTKHPTGARFIPDSQQVSSDKYIASKPEKLEALQNDLENVYPNTNENAFQVKGQAHVGFSDDNPVMGSENTFDTFNDTDPNRYNNNAGLRIPSNEESKGNFIDETHNEAAKRNFLNDDFKSNELDSTGENDKSNYPRNPDMG